jgi:hypothetical protein
MHRREQSAAFVEASTLLANCMLPGALGFKPPAKKEGSGDVAYEMRVYQLKLGYQRVPDFLKLYGGSIAQVLGAWCLGILSFESSV